MRSIKEKELEKNNLMFPEKTQNWLLTKLKMKPRMKLLKKELKSKRELI